MPRWLSRRSRARRRRRWPSSWSAAASSRSRRLTSRGAYARTRRHPAPTTWRAWTRTSASWTDAPRRRRCSAPPASANPRTAPQRLAADALCFGVVATHLPLTRSLLSLRHGGRCGYSQRVRALSRATSSQRRPRPPSLLQCCLLGCLLLSALLGCLLPLRLDQAQPCQVRLRLRRLALSSHGARRSHQSHCVVRGCAATRACCVSFQCRSSARAFSSTSLRQSHVSPVRHARHKTPQP